MIDHVVIVGAGQAGGCCAQGLRRAGHAGRITLVGAERHPPYERPPLSKAVLSGAAEPSSTYLKPLAWYADNAVELRLGEQVTAIDRAARALALGGGDSLSYDALVLATGGNPRRLSVPGADLPGVVYLRDLDHTAELARRIGAGRTLVVIGGGFIGLEVAATARQAGAEVVVIEAARSLMGRTLPAVLGEHYLGLHRAHGADVVLGAAVDRISSRGERLAVVLADGREIVGDTVLAGIGLTPETTLAEAAGLEVADGVLVDHFGRTSDPAIWAIGDCARFHRPGRPDPTRLESWGHAQNHAFAAAANIAGEPRAYDDVPWAWTDQYGVNLQVAGAWDPHGEVVVRGSLTEGKAVLACLVDGAVVAAITLDSGREMRPLQRLIASARRVDPARLADPAVKLADV
jgi:3-phenylpropionate/trans-cinnamate dioxygenase ferredoxin reductase component